MRGWCPPNELPWGQGDCLGHENSFVQNEQNEMLGQLPDRWLCGGVPLILKLNFSQNSEKRAVIKSFEKINLSV